MRNAEIDTLRGMACILLVAYHVVGVDYKAGLLLESGFYRNVNDTLIYFRMPLFTFLSGVVYAYRPFSTGLKSFIYKKIKRLLLPMIFVGTAFAILQSLTPGTNGSVEEWSMLHIYPVAHFWFVESIFIIFVIVALLELTGIFEHIQGCLLIFILSILLFTSDIYIREFSISGVFYLLPYFLLGILMTRYATLKSISNFFALIILFISITIVLMVGVGFLEHYSRRTIFSLFVGSLFCVSILALMPKIIILARIGVYSYSIFIFHVFFTASSRIVLRKIGIEDVNLLFAAGVLSGVVGPIITEKTFDGTNITRLTLLGKKAVDQQDLWLTKRLKSYRWLS